MSKYSENIKTNIDRSQTQRKLDWWIEIYTGNPNCIYYFGGYESYLAAAKERYGFVRDLKTEGARVISIKIKQCQPQQLTICEPQTEFTKREIAFTKSDAIA